MAKEKLQECNPSPDVSMDVKKKINGIIYTLKPLILLEYAFGIYRYNLVNGVLMPSNWKMKTSGVLIVVMVLTAFIANFKLPAAMIGDENIVDTINEVPSIVVLVQYATSAITATFLVNSVNPRILALLANLDSMLNVETWPDFYKKGRSETIKFILLLTFSHVINCIVDLVIEQAINIMSIIVLPLFFIQKLEILVFCNAILMVKCRLLIINHYLKVFVQDQEKQNSAVFTIKGKKDKTDDKYDFIGRAEETNTKIRKLATSYDIVGKICSMINEVFNFQIFMTLVSTFTFVVITIWTSLFYYKQPENYSGELINIAVWCFSTIYTVAIMSVTCERLLQVRNETKILVNKIIMNYDLPKTMRVQAKAFMELVEAWPLRIYIYDMFSVDITLMLKFISVSTTYLIVIIQISHFV